MSLRQAVLDASLEEGIFVRETYRSYILKCPHCNKPDLYFDKTVGNFICFAGSCGEKGNGFKLLSKIKDISYKDAKDLVLHEKEHHKAPGFEVSFTDEVKKPEEEESRMLELEHFYSLDNEESVEGRLYLLNRGIPLKVAQKYDLKYSPIYRRVIFPLMHNGELAGYQARAIDQVDKGARMRNNPGFKKGGYLMFYDKIPLDSKHIIIAEGPVDALKFDLCGGNVASLGKDLSKNQLLMITDLPVERVYWALDDDADNLIPDYVESISKESYIVRVPEAAKKRILESGKDKADFGECTYEECAQAIREAKKISGKILFGV
jgi:DNA primase